MNVLVPLLLIAVMVAFNALYVAAEFSTVGSRRSRVQEDADGGSAPAAGLLEILEDPRRLDNYVAACQIGITLSSLVAGAYGQAALTPLLEPVFGDGGRAVAVLIVLLAITGLQVVIGELLPKTAALRYPERLATATLVPMRISQWLFRPLVAVFNGSAFALMRAGNLDTEHTHAHVHSPEELAGLYRASAAGGLIDASERDMLAGVLNVEDRLVREIMTPRRRLTTVAADETVGDALARVVATPHTRFPVTGEGDDVVGIVSLRDLFGRARREPDATVGSIARPGLDVAEVATVPTLWQRLREQDQHCAMVVNEFGSVVGMVTLEDAIEEIFGEVLDEFDLEDEPVTVAAGRVIARGDVLVQTLVDRFGLRPPDVDVDTVGGLVWHELGRRPRVGDHVTIEPAAVTLRVDAMDETAVTRVSFDLPEQVP
ncbi:MAG: HlyC/CorC family transporter [Acidimicrobiales bacterium]|nr:HlyC/CorC family transporter [Acidimicrobiales bacterium]